MHHAPFHKLKIASALSTHAAATEPTPTAAATTAGIAAGVFVACDFFLDVVDFNFKLNACESHLALQASLDRWVLLHGTDDLFEQRLPLSEALDAFVHILRCVKPFLATVVRLAPALNVIVEDLLARVRVLKLAVTEQEHEVFTRICNAIRKTRVFRGSCIEVDC